MSNSIVSSCTIEPIPGYITHTYKAEDAPVDVFIGNADKAAAETALYEIKLITNQLEWSFIDLCFKLHDAREKGHHLECGYPKFTDWIDAANLSISGRQAYYYLNIADKALQLGIDADALKQVRISKLKEIFTLNPGEHGKQMKELVAEGATASLAGIKDAVNYLKGGPSEAPKFVTYKVSLSAQEVIEAAIQTAKAMNPSGDIDYEMSTGQALEIICAEFMSSYGVL